MRHDPASTAVVVMLKALKMYGMVHAVGAVVEQRASAFDAAVPTLSQLLKAEMAEREVRSIAYRCDRCSVRSTFVLVIPHDVDCPTTIWGANLFVICSS